MSWIYLHINTVDGSVETVNDSPIYIRTSNQCPNKTDLEDLNRPSKVQNRRTKTSVPLNEQSQPLNRIERGNTAPFTAAQKQDAMKYGSLVIGSCLAP